ncbi:MAG: hypothetical protein GXP62_00330 [Oligoflexia bacterium]|nr:hypothetical protein [Oligoflexia bacterium]
MQLEVDPGKGWKPIDTSVAGLPAGQLDLGGNPPPTTGGYSFFDGDGNGSFAATIPVPDKASVISASVISWAGDNLLVDVEIGPDDIGAGAKSLAMDHLNLMPPGAKLDDAAAITLEVDDTTHATLQVEKATFVCLSDVGIDSGGDCSLGDDAPVSIRVQWALDDAVQVTQTGGPLCL